MTMADSGLNQLDAFACPRCGTLCDVKQEGDLLIARCPAGDRHYRLTLHAPSDVAAGGDGPLVGQTLGPCRLVRRIGSEGGLPLYEGLDPLLGQPRTVRVLSGTQASDQACVQAFVNAGKLAAAARHTVLANVTHLDRFEGGLFTVAPALEGQPLDQAVHAAGRLHAPDALRIARRLAEGLATLHDRQVVHRNVGPKSVYILPDGEPRLRNFALAIGPSAPGDPHEVAGQPGYLAPEQVAGGALDGRADLYGLGALLYYALVGRPAFLGRTPGDIIRAQVAGPAAPRDALAAVVSPQVADFVMSLMSTAPGERPEHARAVSEALAKLAEGAPRPVKAAAPREPREDRLAFVETGSGDSSRAKLNPRVPQGLSPRKPELVRKPAARPMLTPPSKEESSFALSTEEPAITDEERMRPAMVSKPESFGQTPVVLATSRPGAASPTPAAKAADLPGPSLDDLVLQTDEQTAPGKKPKADDTPLVEVEVSKPKLTPRMIGLGAVAAVLLIVAVWHFWPSGAAPSKAPAPTQTTAPAKATKKGEPPPPAADDQREFAIVEDFAKKNPKGVEEIIKRCDAFLEKFPKSPAAAPARKIRQDALAGVRDKDAEAALPAAIQAVQNRRVSYPQRLAAADAFLKKYAGTRAATDVQKHRDLVLAERDSTADAAAKAARPNLEKLLQAETYGPACAALAALAETYEGTQTAAAAAAELADLRGKLATRFKAVKDGAERLFLETKFRDAVAQLDAPMTRWQADDMKKEATALAETFGTRRAAILQGYGAFLREFDPLVTAWKFEAAHAAATDAAGKADEPVLRALLEGKAADAAAMLLALDRVVAGAKAEQAKAAKGDGKILLQRSIGARLKATIDNPTRAGLHVEMLGHKGPLPWSEIHMEQIAAFAAGAPGKASAAERHGLGLIALSAGAFRIGFDEFKAAVEADAQALDGIVASLRRHAQGFVYLPACEFPAGTAKQRTAADALLLARAEVTNAEYAFYASANKIDLPSDWKTGRDDYPVANVTWQQADAYAQWLGMRLPTSLEWERAVRGTEGHQYPWGNTFEAGWVNLARPPAKGGPPAPASLLQAYRRMSRRDDSPFFHLVGNVREWTSTAQRDAKGVAVTYETVGASAAELEKDAAAHLRAPRKPDAADPYVGFRLAWPR